MEEDMTYTEIVKAEATKIIQDGERYASFVVSENQRTKPNGPPLSGKARAVLEGMLSAAFVAGSGRAMGIPMADLMDAVTEGLEQAQAREQARRLL